MSFFIEVKKTLLLRVSFLVESYSIALKLFGDAVGLLRKVSVFMDDCFFILFLWPF